MRRRIGSPSASNTASASAVDWFLMGNGYSSGTKGWAVKCQRALLPSPGLIRAPGAAPLYSVVTQPADPDAPGVVKYAVETDGEIRATGELMPQSWFGDGTGQLLNVRWNDGLLRGWRRDRRSGSRGCPSGRRRALRLPQRGARERRRSGRQCCEQPDFELWQAKQGFVFTDEGQHLPDPEGVSFASAAQVGAIGFVRSRSECQAGHVRSDGRRHRRIDRRSGRHRALLRWFFGRRGGRLWFVITDRDGTMSDMSPSAPWTSRTAAPSITSVSCTTSAATAMSISCSGWSTRPSGQRGWKQCVSETDTDNRPMWNAFERNGHFPGVRPWQRWMYIRRAVADRAGTRLPGVRSAPVPEIASGSGHRHHGHCAAAACGGSSRTPKADDAGSHSTAASGQPATPSGSPIGPQTAHQSTEPDGGRAPPAAP